VTFEIGTNGQAVELANSERYIPSTWPEFEAMLASDDPEWPGSVSPNMFVINFKTDDYPEENSWELFVKPDETVSNWDSISSWSAADSGYRVLESSEMAIGSLGQGWYRFVVRDTEGDGTCCTYGKGFVSLTGPIAAKGGESGLIWGNDGKFWAMDEVFFYVDEKGWINYINFLQPGASELTTAASKSIVP